MNKKIALITGASRGLGKSTALHLAAQGVDVIGTYYSKQAEAQAVVAEIEALGGRAHMLQLDVSDSSSFDAFSAQLAQTLGDVFQVSQFDFLVNNAGVGIYNSFAETSEAQFDQLVDIHFKGPFFLTQKLLPLLADGGRIVNVSSGLARFSLVGYAAYASMKGAIEVWTRYLAKELGPRGINVNVLAPGAIATDFGGGATRDNPEVNQMIASSTALGRVGEADDIGAAISMLLGDGGKWINGQRIEASGGIFL
ncbi:MULTISPECIES: SDR family NAD(P)-dependent oxidoreductase [Pseudomonas]|jgi:NAD(P)-dependent dehydrogenase (short-subunit alcohol dehydrogenase family)|uniref:Short-chain dehydrogenase n=1 Tax=Pseudomonas syringae TaxID=317 RepID=A0A085UZ64_PSESX|nr:MULTISPECIES: SDR family oxidoreductase [Pseudomonas]EPJ87939.1 short chain dehydrogenase [Pseudomonas sp. CFII64]KFE48477.1 short-chain dehydrogenase [Pseudomonas syringae]